MALHLHESTTVRFSPSTFRVVDAMDDATKRYLSAKLRHPHLLDVEPVMGVPAERSLVRIKFYDTWRAAARHVGNCLCIIDIGPKKRIERGFQTYSRSSVTINDCVPLEKTPLHRFVLVERKRSEYGKEEQNEIPQHIKRELCVTTERLDDLAVFVDELQHELGTIKRDKNSLACKLNALEQQVNHLKEAKRDTLWQRIQRTVFGKVSREHAAPAHQRTWQANE